MKPKIEYWIAALDEDSYNYFPKKIRKNQVKEAEKEGFIIWNSEKDAQDECDQINSI